MYSVRNLRKRAYAKKQQQLFVSGLMFYLRYLCLCLLAHSGVQHIMRSVFLRLVYPMLAVSLECPFLISLSLFSNIYLYYIFVGIWIISSNLCKLFPTFFSQCHIRFQMCNLLGLKLRWWNVRHLFTHNSDFLNSMIYCLYIYRQMSSRCDGCDTLYSIWSILSSAFEIAL